MTDSNKEKLDIYTSKAKADKAINSLKGILLAINFDNQVHEKEIKELQQWAHSHKELINRNPFKEFMDIINYTISNNIPHNETIEDLYWLCQKYEHNSLYYNGVTSDLQILQGICHGILSDGIINDQEVLELNNWLENNEHLSSYYPYDEIRSLILSVLADSVIDDEEKTILKSFFSQFVVLKDNETSEAIKLKTKDVLISGVCTSSPNVTFKDKAFCITGVLKRGKREDVLNDIVKLGGFPTENVNLKTDYLIVGDNGNPAWAFSCYGRKVEKAINMRKNGHNIMIIHEFDFADLIDDLK